MYAWLTLQEKLFGIIFSIIFRQTNTELPSTRYLHQTVDLPPNVVHVRQSRETAPSVLFSNTRPQSLQINTGLPTEDNLPTYEEAIKSGSYFPPPEYEHNM